MRYRFYTTDVFTDRVFGGNPLAVFPDADGLAPTTMQRIAAEFGVSETVFVLPPEHHGHTRRLRIFTPGTELPFAGHPTVGTATSSRGPGTSRCAARRRGSSSRRRSGRCRSRSSGGRDRSPAPR